LDSNAQSKLKEIDFLPGSCNSITALNFNVTACKRVREQQEVQAAQYSTKHIHLPQNIINKFHYIRKTGHHMK
jgi:hypothetical protein